MNKTIIIILVIALIIVIGGVYFLSLPKKNNMSETPNNPPADNQPNNNPPTDGQQTPATSFEIQGMKVEILKEGTGEGAKSGDNISVNYTGMLLDGKKFDSSVDSSFGHVEPFPYTLGQNMVIKGWELGLLGMKVGEKRKLTIPSDLAYGDSGYPPKIPPKATLIFEIDMLSINK